MNDQYSRKTLILFESSQFYADPLNFTTNIVSHRLTANSKVSFGRAIEDLSLIYTVSSISRRFRGYDRDNRFTGCSRECPYCFILSRRRPSVTTVPSKRLQREKGRPAVEFARRTWPSVPLKGCEDTLLHGERDSQSGSCFTDCRGHQSAGDARSCVRRLCLHRL